MEENSVHMLKNSLNVLVQYIRTRGTSTQEMSWIHEATVLLTVCQNGTRDQCNDCQPITLVAHTQLWRNNVLMLPGTACQFSWNIPQLLWPPDICTVNYDTNYVSCAGSPSILTLNPMFILNISINMTDKTASKLEWFMCRPPYHAK